jgi:hypothetical protein
MTSKHLLDYEVCRSSLLGASKLYKINAPEVVLSELVLSEETDSYQ